MIALLLTLAVSQSDPLEKELSEIVRRLDSAELADREAAVGELEAFARKAGGKAAGFLKKHADSANGEIRARIQGHLEFLARLDECRKTLAVFDAAGLPDCAGKTFGTFNTGHWRRSGESLLFTYAMGWVISETKDEVTLAETNLITTTYKSDRKLPEEWDLWKDQHPKDMPLPGELRKLDFGAFCRRLLSSGTKKQYDDLDHLTRGCLPYGVEPALYAYWALRRGEEKLALDLVDLSRRALSEPDNPGRKPSFEDRLAAGVAVNLRWQAINRAHGGEPRVKILERWRTLERIAPDLHEGEPKQMVRLYAELLAEDGNRKEPSAEEVAKMTPAARAAMWLHRLRDHAARQRGQPAGCDVLGRYWPIEGVVNPAQELVTLGWEALPAVIDRLDDPHPTRCMGYYRDFDPDSFYLLSVRTCCQEVFEAIAGELGDAPASQAAARQWWNENKDLGAEKYYLKGLDSKERLPFSAKKLLELDREKHLPSLIEILAKGDRGRRNAVLYLIHSHLGKEHRPLLLPILDDKALPAVETAAEVLWATCGDERGLTELMARLRAARDEKEGEFSPCAFDLMAKVRSDVAVQTLCDLMASPINRLRMEAIFAAAKLPSRKTAEALLSNLGDKAPSGWSAKGYDLRFCDSAAESLLEMLHLSKQFRLRSKEDERDRTIAELMAWWGKNRDAVDWDAHVRRIDESRAPKK